MEGKSPENETAWAHGLAVGMLRTVSKGLGERCMPLEEQNRLMLEFLIFCAETEQDAEILERLKEIRDGKDETWHRHWLKDLPWIRELFFRYYVLGEHAVADAECVLLGREDGYRRVFERAFAMCAEFVSQHPEGTTSPIAAVEQLLSAFESGVRNFGRMDGSDAALVALRIIQNYARAANREDLVVRLRTSVDDYLSRCSEMKMGDCESKASLLGALAGNRLRSPYENEYAILKDMLGEYVHGFDKRRANNVAFDFDRNIRMIGCADAVTRMSIDKGFREKYIPRDRKSRNVAEVLLEGKTALVTYSVLEDFAPLPDRIKSRILCYRLLNSLLYQLSQNAVFDKCYNTKKGQVKVAGRLSRSEGWQGFFEKSPEEKQRLNYYAGEIVSHLTGWDGKVYEDGEDMCEKVNEARSEPTKRKVRITYGLQRWVEDRVGQGGIFATNVPILRLLDGGLTFKTLLDVIGDCAGLVMKGDFYSSSKVADERKPVEFERSIGRDEESGEDEKKEERADPTSGDALVEYENKELRDLLYRVVAENDKEYARYLRMVLFEDVSKKDALKIMCREGQTNWAKDRAKKCLTKCFGQIRQSLDPDQAERFKQYLLTIMGNR